MIRLNILTNNSCPNSRAFNFPILASKHLLEKLGISAKFAWKISPHTFECDILAVNSNVFRTYWTSRKNDIFAFLEKASSSRTKILWFDTTDSTWCTQFEAMPFVSKFLKGQILADRSLYLKTFRTGRIFTDVFDELYSSSESPADYPPARPDDLPKLSLSWNSSLENYTESRYSLGGKIRNALRPLLANFADEKIRVQWSDPRTPRRILISSRFGKTHSRPSVTAHRRALGEILRKRGVRDEKIPLPDYFAELRNSQMAASPFGVGEITLRDFEIVISGAALLKPDMSHLETWPELFKSSGASTDTYMAHRWDLSDLDEKIDQLLGNADARIGMAENAQNAYRKVLSEEGTQLFTERFSGILKI